MSLEYIPPTSLKNEKLIGAGGMGEVYRGEWHKNGTIKTVAIKKIKREYRHFISRDDAIKECQIQFQVRHPNIIPILGYSGYQNDFWIVMKYVDGSDLFKLIFSGASRISYNQALKYACEICNAIWHIHEAGYVHCDIKPQNIMVDKLTDRLYICDFGIARYLGDLNQQAAVAQLTLSCSGTQNYMAPEILNVDQYGRRHRPTWMSDIWSLGVTTYELFTKTQFNEAAMGPRLASLQWPLQAIVSSALHRNPQSRHNAATLGKGFQNLMAQLGVPGGGQVKQNCQACQKCHRCHRCQR